MEESAVVVGEGGRGELRPYNPTDTWKEAFTMWLDAHAANTRKAYAAAWKSFLSSCSLQPWEVGKADVARWVDELRRKGLSPATIAQRVAGISSFYDYCREEYEIVTPDGRYESLHDYNPAGAPSLRGAVNPFGKATSLNSVEARALLAAIPRDTVQGRRDFALILTYLATGRRNSEVRLLKWGDFEERGERIWYRWSGKGKVDLRFELPRPVWGAIRAYAPAGSDEDYVFAGEDGQPLSALRVWRMVKRYARLAGLDPSKVRVHTLRHTAAMLRKDVGDPVDVISSFLAHSSLAVTQIYLHQVEGQRDTSWAKVEVLLGLS